MKLLYSGGTDCSYRTLQRMVLMADEICFMDRPSVTFDGWGTVGSRSRFRSVDTSESPISFRFCEPPSGPVTPLYEAYIRADLSNPEFKEAFYECFGKDAIFRNRFVRQESNYRDGITGREVIAALLSDPGIIRADLTSPVNGKMLFDVTTPQGQVETMKVILIEASIHLSNAILLSSGIDLRPVSDDPSFCRLMSLRSGSARYIHQPAALASYLGLEIASAVIPDQALDQLQIKDLFEFRRASEEAHKHWTEDLDRLALSLSDVPADRIELEVARLVATEVQPKLREYRNEMEATRDKLFGSLVSRVGAWEMPTLTLAYAASFSPYAALAAFAGALLPSIPAVVDFVNSRRDLRRRNSLTYLIDARGKSK